MIDGTGTTSYKSYVSGGRTGHFYVIDGNGNQEDMEWLAAHEFGHFMGLGDTYNENHLAQLFLGAPRKTWAQQGWERNIMSEHGGTTSKTNITTLVKVNSGGLFTPSKLTGCVDQGFLEWYGDVLRLTIAKGRILNIRVAEVTRPAIAFEVEQAGAVVDLGDDGTLSIPLSFAFLDQGDGATLCVMTDSPDTRLAIKGTVIDMKEGVLTLGDLFKNPIQRLMAIWWFRALLTGIPGLLFLLVFAQPIWFSTENVLDCSLQRDFRARNSQGS